MSETLPDFENPAEQQPAETPPKRKPRKPMKRQRGRPKKAVARKPGRPTKTNAPVADGSLTIPAEAVRVAKAYLALSPELKNFALALIRAMA